MKKSKAVFAEWPKGGSCKIAIVGEAPGLDESLAGSPFVGASGKVLDGFLKHVGLKREDCLVTNVFTVRPRENNVKEFFGGKKYGPSMEQLKHGIEAHNTHGNILEEHIDDLLRLREEIRQVKPNLILALGATPLWALTGNSTITKYRGTIIPSTLVPGVKVLATFHPAYIMRNWADAHYVANDLLKAVREAEYPHIERPVRHVWIDPTLDDLATFEDKYMQDITHLAYDIETDPWQTMQIRCIGFSPSPFSSIVVPFMDRRFKDWSYWPTAEDEKAAMRWVRRHLSNPDTVKIAQNGMYDVQWLARKFAIKVRGIGDDTMLMHHALQPELSKSLGVLASVYTSEAPWKTMMDWKQKGNKTDV